MQLPIEIESAFESGTTVLTANVRAARWLRREYGLRQRAAGRKVWASPAIEDWEGWVQRLWQAHSMARGDAPLLLTSLQERSVWTRMQRDDAKLLVSPEGMAALAEEAYALLCDYEAHAERDHTWGQRDAERFRQWAASFDRECARQGWVGRAKLESLVTERVGELALPAKIVMLGFDRITPARARLIAAMEASGVEVTVCGEGAAAAPRLVRATDLRDEITTCAHWVRGMLEETPLFEERPPARIGERIGERIGVIVPELGAVRSEIERIFRRVLMPETDDVSASAARMPFEFSLGQPLGDVPVIRAALLLLRWAAGPLREEEVSWLLLSGYLQGRDQGTGSREQGSAPPTQAKTGLGWGTEDLEGRDQGTGSREQGGAPPTQAKTGLEWGTEDLQGRDRGTGSRDQTGSPRTQVKTGLGWGTSGFTAKETEVFRGLEEGGTAGPSTALPFPDENLIVGAPVSVAPLRMTSTEIYLALGTFDAGLRNSGSLSLEISLRKVLRAMRGFPALADLRSRLEEMQKMAAVNHVVDEERTAGRWVDLAQFLLDQAGWRGAAKRDEIDFQARARWERLLDEVALLDFDGRRMRYSEFLDVLVTQANETIFAAESHGAPVQVMGAMEASGQRFDAVWFLGADDQKWPARGRLHPLLPNDVQRRAGMPHADADDDWELAKVVTERIQGSVFSDQRSEGTGIREQGSGLRPEGGILRQDQDRQWGTRRSVIFSYAERDKDGELRPSPLIAQVAGLAHVKPKPGLDWGTEDGPAQNCTSHSKPKAGFEWGTQGTGEWERSAELLAELGVEAAGHRAGVLDEITDASGTIAWPKEQCAGGASVLKDQAACPFRAFAAKRLNAEELNRSDWGLSAMERGRLLHEVMEQLWSPEKGRLHTLEDLQAALREGRLREVIEGAIGDVFEKIVADQRGDAWMEAYLASEQRRLRTRLEEWLQIESKRVPFTVEATEKRLDDVSVGGLKLRLRADRIDQVGDGTVTDGRRLLIDYKSGEVATKDWEGERLNEPQLPLYAIFGNVEDVCGVVFARIRAGETKLEGRVSDARAQLFADAGTSSKLVTIPYDAALRDEWTAALVNLAEDFLAGDAQVDPKEGKKTCRFCEFPGLCRVAELRQSLVEEDDTEAGEGDE